MVEVRKIRWCETHNCEHYLKDACSRKMIALGGGPMSSPSGAVGIIEQLEGPRECVEGWRTLLPYSEPPDEDAFPLWGHSDGGVTPWDYDDPNATAYT